MNTANKHSFFNYIIKNSSKLFSANIIVAIIAFVCSPFLTRMYSVENFGILAIFLTIIGLLSIVSSLRLEYAIILPKKDKNTSALFNGIFLNSLLISLIAFIFLHFFKDFLQIKFKLSNFNIWYFFIPIGAFLLAMNQASAHLLNRLKKYQIFSIFIIIIGLNSILKIAFGYIKCLNAIGLILGVISANALALFFSIFFLRLEKINIQQTIAQIKKHKNFPLFNLPHAAVNYVSGNLPIFLFPIYFGNYVLGLYGFAIGLVHKLINSISNSLYAVLLQQNAEALNTNRKTYENLIFLLKRMFNISIIPFIIGAAIAPYFFKFYNGENYFEAGIYLRYMTPWLFLVFMATPISYISNVYNKQKEALILETTHLIVRVIAICIGIFYESFELCLILFSSVGVLYLTYYIFWSLNIVKYAEKNLEV